MDIPLKIEFMTRIPFFIIISYFIYKLATLFLKKESHLSTKSQELDSIIQGKIQSMRAKNQISQGSKNHQKSYSKIAQSYQTLIDELTDDKKGEFEPIIDLIKDLSWGEGFALKNLQKLSSTSPHLLIPLPILSHQAREYFQNFDIKKKPNYESIAKTISYHAFFLYLSKIDFNPKELSNIASSWKKSYQAVFMGLIHLRISTLKHGQKNLIESLLLKDLTTKMKQLPIDQKMILDNLYSRYPLVDDLLESWKSISEVFYALAPLVMPTNLKEAKKLLGLSTSDPKRVKKQYHKLGQIYHPDRLAGHKISATLLKMSNENFAAIQKAFDIISE